MTKCFESLVGPEVLRLKDQVENAPKYKPLSTSEKLKAVKRSTPSSGISLVGVVKSLQRSGSSKGSSSSAAASTAQKDQGLFEGDDLVCPREETAHWLLKKHRGGVGGEGVGGGGDCGGGDGGGEGGGGGRAGSFRGVHGGSDGSCAGKDDAAENVMSCVDSSRNIQKDNAASKVITANSGENLKDESPKDVWTPKTKPQMSPRSASVDGLLNCGRSPSVDDILNKGVDKRLQERGREVGRKKGKGEMAKRAKSVEML